MANISTIKVGTTSYGIEAAHAAHADKLANSSGTGVSAGSTSTPVYFNAGTPTAVSTGIFKKVVYFNTFDDLTTTINTAIAGYSGSQYCTSGNYKIIFYPICNKSSAPGSRISDIGQLVNLNQTVMHFVGLTLDFCFCDKIYCNSPAGETVIQGENLSLKNLRIDISETGTPKASTNMHKIYLYNSAQSTNCFAQDVCIDVENCDITCEIIPKSGASSSAYNYFKILHIEGSCRMLNNNIYTLIGGRGSYSYCFVFNVELNALYQHQIIGNNFNIVVNSGTSGVSIYCLNIKDYYQTAATSSYNNSYIRYLNNSYWGGYILLGHFYYRATAADSYTNRTTYKDDNNV